MTPKATSSPARGRKAERRSQQRQLHELLERQRDLHERAQGARLRNDEEPPHRID